MCTLCNIRELNWHLFGKFYLVYARLDDDKIKTGQIGILRVNHPDIIFSVPPVPREKCKDENEYYDRLYVFQKEFICYPELGAALLRSARKVGYRWSPKYYEMSVWLYDKIANIMMLVQPKEYYLTKYELKELGKEKMIKMIRNGHPYDRKVEQKIKKVESWK